MPCAFCGASPTTREHIFPRWFERYLPPDRRQRREVARYGEGGFDIQHPVIGLDALTASVLRATTGGSRRPAARTRSYLRHGGVRCVPLTLAPFGPDRREDCAHQWERGEDVRPGEQREDDSERAEAPAVLVERGSEKGRRCRCGTADDDRGEQRTR